MKVIVFINENDLTAPEVFATIEDFENWHKENGFETGGTDWDLMIAALHEEDGRFASQGYFVAWKEIHHQMLNGREKFHLMLDLAMSQTQEGHSLLVRFTDLMTMDLLNRIDALEEKRT